MATETTKEEIPQTLSKFNYETLIAEEEINPADLTTEIKKKINALSMQKALYVKNPSKQKWDSLKKQDAVICDLIQDQIEEKLPPAAAIVKDEATLAAEKAESERLEKEAAAQQVKADATAKFAAAIAKDGRIHRDTLKSMMNAAGEKFGDKDTEEFAGVKLRRGMSTLSSVHYYKQG